MAEGRYHVRFEDAPAGEELGLMLVETPQVGITRRLINPYAAKGSTGATKDSDLTEWSVVSQRDWRGGRGQEEFEEATAFLDAWNLETRIEGQLTLGPLPQNPSGDYPRYEPGSAERYCLGWPPAEQNQIGGEAGPLKGDEKWGQRFLVYGLGHGFDHRIGSVDLRLRKLAGASGYIRMGIHADDDGLPGAEMTHKDLDETDVGLDYAWISFELAAALDVDTLGYYWIVLSTNSSIPYQWEMSKDDPYRRGQKGYAAAYVSGVWYDRAPYYREDMTFQVHWQPISLAMSFEAPAGGITCNIVQFYLQTMYAGFGFTAKLCEDNAGVPGTVLQSKAIDLPEGKAGLRWVEVAWDSGEALTGGVTYHIVIEPDGEAGNSWWLRWGSDPAAGYAGGAAHKQFADEAWVDEARDLYFRINRDVLDGWPTAFARYKGKWYCAAGETVYEWDEGGLMWDVSDAQAGDDVTALEVWGGYLWAARGTACVLRRYNGGWADAPGAISAQLLRAGGGYLHYSGAAAGDTHKVYYTVNGTDWSDAIEIGGGDHAVTGMTWYRDMLVVSNAARLWGISAEIGYPLLDWSTQEDTDNGRGMLVWGRTGCLYIPLMYGLYRWNGDTMVAVGPEQGMGLPAARAGKIAALVGTGNWLFAAIDAGTSGYSSVLAYNGMGGWHELQRCEQDGQRVRALGFETVHTPSRLWFGMGNETRYLKLPDKSDNPWQWTGYEFNASGEIETSWMGEELLEVVKDFQEVVIRGEGINNDQSVSVYYEVDRSGRWTYLGEVTHSPREALAFQASGFVAKTIGTGSTQTTIELDTGHTTVDMAAGDWCRINGQVAQVASITDGDTFVLETALSAAPASGDVVYASRPAGREFRLKLVLFTTDKTATPKVKAMFVQYQNNVLDRFVYALQIRVEDGMRDLAGNPYPHTAADLRVLLDGWAMRVTPFTLYDQDGVEHTVKVTSVGEGGMTRRSAEGQAGRYGSVYSTNVVEVE